MDDIINETAASFDEGVLNETAHNVTKKIPATPEGMALAYGSLFLMAILPIFFGSFRSVKHQKHQKETGEVGETMSNRDAAMFPIIASGALFGIYLFFKFFSKDYINMLLSGYFFLLGVLALTHLVAPYFSKLIPEAFPDATYHLHFSEEIKDNKNDVLNYSFTRKDGLCLILCSFVGIWYIIKKHWVANNLFGLAFSINGIELLQLNQVSTGCILLMGLFIYDIFWVFGTNVMVTVAKSFDAPIKLVFPQDILEKGFSADNFAMLGLGDIVIPGIFIALLLRFDCSLSKVRKTYFYCGFIAYILGLGLTILVMHVFKHAQPALLYLVPACLGLPLLTATIKGEIKAMFSYQDNPPLAENDEKKSD